MERSINIIKQIKKTDGSIDYIKGWFNESISSKDFQNEKEHKNINRTSIIKSKNKMASKIELSGYFIKGKYLTKVV